MYFRQMKSLFTVTCLLLLFGNCYSLPSEINDLEADSIKTFILDAKHDSDVVNAYIDWDNLIFHSNPKLDLQLNKKIQKICETNLKLQLNEQEKLFFKSAISNSYNNLGICYTNFGDYSSSLKYYSKGIEIAQELKDKDLEAKFMNNLGNVYGDLGEPKKSIKLYQQSLEIEKEFGDEKRESGSYINIGGAYSELGDNEKAMNFFIKALEIDRKYEDHEGIGISLNNIGDIYFEEKQFEKR